MDLKKINNPAKWTIQCIYRCSALEIRRLVVKRSLSLIVVALLVLNASFFGFALDDYPDYLKNKPQDELIDPWSFYNRECTSFVAWCLNSRNGVDFTNFYKGVQWGNAVDWVGAARSVGVRVDKKPAVGAVAWFDGEYGHVSYVVDLSEKGIKVEEYNVFRPGAYNERLISYSGVDYYIHFGGTDDFLKDQVTWAQNVAYSRDNYYKGSYTGRWQHGMPKGEGAILFDEDAGIHRKRGAIKYKGRFEDGYPSGEGRMFFEDRTEIGVYYGAHEAGKTVFEGEEVYRSGIFSGFRHSYKLRVKQNNELEYYDEEWFRYYERLELTSAEAEAMKRDESLFKDRFGDFTDYADEYSHETYTEAEAEMGEEGVGTEPEVEKSQESEKETETEGLDMSASVNEMGFSKLFSYEEGLYSDVFASDWFEPWVAKASEYGLVKGNKGSFTPMGYITYAEIITIASRIHSTYYGKSINDYPHGKWYRKYHEYALAEGIIENYMNEEELMQRANRSESVGVLSRALPPKAFVPKNTVADSAIPDVKMEDANSSPIYSFYRAGILSGSDATGRFNPLKFITRAEISKIIVCMVEEGSRKSFELFSE